jgi:hypothetical protein
VIRNRESLVKEEEDAVTKDKQDKADKVKFD